MTGLALPFWSLIPKSFWLSTASTHQFLSKTSSEFVNFARCCEVITLFHPDDVSGAETVNVRSKPCYHSRPKSQSCVSPDARHYCLHVLTSSIAGTARPRGPWPVTRAAWCTFLATLWNIASRCSTGWRQGENDFRQIRKSCTTSVSGQPLLILQSFAGNGRC